MKIRRDHADSIGVGETRIAVRQIDHDRVAEHEAGETQREAQEIDDRGEPMTA
jgi:hypothetical protein